MDNSDFFIVGNALNKENLIIFILSLDHLDSLHGKLSLHAMEEGILQGVRVHLDIFSEHGSRLVIF
jgi:hypothetical protein